MVEILLDYELIVHKLSTELDEVNIYPLGDLHIGSEMFDVEKWLDWKRLVLSDSNGLVVINGDLMDNGLKNSKTNSYEATIRPREQKEWLKTQLKPFRERIIGVCQGNHEGRSTLLSDDCPMYDVMSKLDLEDLYRENMAFIKINLGHKNADRQWSYTMALTHGASKNKTEQFSYAMDGVDIFVTGHTHQPTSRFPAKIVVDSQNEVVRIVEMSHVVVPSFQRFGGYAMKGLYLPQGSKIPIITLSGKQKGVKITWV